MTKLFVQEKPVVGYGAVSKMLLYYTIQRKPWLHCCICEKASPMVSLGQISDAETASKKGGIIMDDNSDLELSLQDKIYLSSPGFESYMIAGWIFVIGMTLSIVITTLIHREPLFWPGTVLSVIVAFVVLQKLKKREYNAKLREIRENPRVKDRTHSQTR